MPCCCTQICHLAQICWPPSAACPLPHHPSVAARSAAAGATLAEGRLEIHDPALRVLGHLTVRGPAPGGAQAPSAFSTASRCCKAHCMVRLYGCAGCLSAHNGGLGRGQLRLSVGLPSASCGSPRRRDPAAAAVVVAEVAVRRGTHFNCFVRLTPLYFRRDSLIRN
jgi:hypothetical protein